MLRFIVAYRWELWLLLAPLLAGILASFSAVLAAFAYDSGALGWPNVAAFVIVGNLVLIALLLPFYGRVRGLGRRFLSLVWGCALGLAIVDFVVVLVIAALRPDLDSSFSAWTWTLIWTLPLIMQLPLMLWFAREASRLSLTHALFLYLIMERSTLTETAIRTQDPFQMLLVLVLFYAVYLGAGLLFAWLLGNFERRSAVFRQRAVGLMIAAYVVVPTVEADGRILWLSLPFLLISFALPLALIYLVRVREPVAPPGDGEPPGSRSRTIDATP